jgi:NADPH:quinone reductase-like Zn-dependent oxidoreductase
VAPKYCTPEGYEIAELPKPEIKDPHDILVKVYAASINPHDVKEAKGMMKPVYQIP